MPESYEKQNCFFSWAPEQNVFENQIKSKLTDSKKDEVPAEFGEMHPKIN